MSVQSKRLKNKIIGALAAALVIGTLLMAGTDTTRNQLASAVQIFSEHPDQWALLAEHPELAPKAVEEAMRRHGATYASILQDLERGALTEVDVIDGAVVERGRECGIPTGWCERPHR